MAIVVQKYGGSSVSDVEKIRRVAQRVRDRRAQGSQVVVVVSAMGDTTDELLALAKKVSPNPPRRELDMLLTCGERISMALLSMALQELGVPAISFTGSQSGIITDDAHSQARIVEVRPLRIHEALDQDKVVIVAGYQGVSRQREVTTLGRGGSDTTAVALAAALAADCEIYSDVDGVFSADPRIVKDAKKLETLSYEEMQELAHAGARVLNAQAVEFAREKNIVIHAKTTHGVGTGTRIEDVKPAGGMPTVRGVAGDTDLWVIAYAGDHAQPLIAFLERRSIRIRMLSTAAFPGASTGYMGIPLHDVHGPDVLKKELNDQLGKKVTVHENLGTVTCVGQGIGTQPLLLRRMQSHAQNMGCAPWAVHASPLAVSLLVERGYVAELTRKLHEVLVLRDPREKTTPPPY